MPHYLSSGPADTRAAVYKQERSRVKKNTWYSMDFASACACRCNRVVREKLVLSKHLGNGSPKERCAPRNGFIIQALVDEREPCSPAEGAEHALWISCSQLPDLYWRHRFSA